ncbi:SDR family oxidoreductase [Halorussus gelatinilyticus]|uniref:SDR family oxidoreductase n=1 Tax=Halorussus gelatinilyticus TaxID=2937524 RepID=A0A8U0IF06_9EURY|nr:SDR family oxidoreductase [Halorussus gelatinilyticus]UPV99334.1 SDR family oxidoreductase [Halorussus gelatinilyticus]
MTETVLITGCSSGIGQETARAFLQDGWEVYATARNPADVESLGEAGANIASLDVTDGDDVERVVERIIDEEGRVDCLVNNAGYAQLGPVEDVPVESVEDQFAVNVFGPHRLTREVLPHMRERRTGTIVNVSSVAGRLATPGMGIYNGSKFAVEGISDALRPEVSEFGIDVVLVEPGPVDTAFVERANDEIDGLERSDAYDSLYSILDDSEAIGGGGPGAVQPREVAETILDAANLTDPADRYPVGQVAKVAMLGRFVPARLRDKFYRLAFSLVTKVS